MEGASASSMQSDQLGTKPKTPIYKAYRCNQCETRFTHPSHRARHVREQHRGVRLHQCTWCNKTFARKYQLTRHLNGPKVACSYKEKYYRNIFEVLEAEIGLPAANTPQEGTTQDPPSEEPQAEEPFRDNQNPPAVESNVTPAQEPQPSGSQPPADGTQDEDHTVEEPPSEEIQGKNF